MAKKEVELKEPQRPYPPSPYEYDAKVERKYIYSYYQIAPGKDEDDDWDDDEDDDWTKKPPEIPIGEVDLLWLMSQIPKPICPSQVKIELGDDSNCMSFDGYYVRFYYEVAIPAKKDEYAAAKKKYEAELAKYDVDIADYRAAKHLQEVKELKARLKKLEQEG